MKRPLAHSVADGPTQRALRAIESNVDDLIVDIDDLQTQISSLPTGGVTLPIAESDVTNLVADLAGKAPTSRTLTGTDPIRIDGGASGDLTANRTISANTFGSAQAGVVPASGGGTVNFLRADGTWAAAGKTYYPHLFWVGFGSHGSLHFDGTSVVAGITPATDAAYPQNGSHTYKMSEDIDATDITVDAGVSLITRDYRGFWTGTFTNNGLVGNPGEAAINTTGASAISSGFYPLGNAGGDGRSNSNGAGFAGNDSTAVPRIWATHAAGNAASTGQGGQGGTCGGNAGGLGGALTVTTASSGTFTLINLLQGRVGTSFSAALSFGSGGGGGAISGYTSGTAGGGGGGGGGGAVFFGGNILAGNGVFTVAGGAAGSPSYSGIAPCACGGGAGGGGGIGGMVYNTNVGTCSYTAAGGVKTNGINAGGNGNAGAAGTWVVASGDGT